MKTIRLTLWFSQIDNYDNGSIYDDDDVDDYEENMTNNTIVQDHRKLFEWSWARNNSGLPIDMVFNDGHLLSIIVYRYVNTGLRTTPYLN